MDQNVFKIGITITLLAALISGGNMAHADGIATSTSEAATVTEAPASTETGIIGGSVARSAFTLAVVNREPRDTFTTLTNDQHHVYYFTELKGMAGQSVSHRWSYNGQTVAEVKFDVGATRWRIWSNKTLPSDWTGKWTVTVIDELGQEVSSESFDYIAAENAAQ